MNFTRITAGLLAAALMAAGSVPAGAGTPVSRQMTCPIGGAAFTFNTTASHSTWGSRPDGKPYGSWEFPLAIPECPDNGLVLYKDYEPAEIERLTPLVASEGYRAIRDEATYYRAYWLMREMGLEAEAYLWALLQASWQADADPERKKKYQQELIERSAMIPPAASDLNWVGMEARAVNALRELGRFDDARSRLDMMPLATLDVPAPATGESGAAAHAAGQKRAWFEFLTDLRTAITRGDASSEPLDLIPRREALNRCLEGAGLDAAGQAFCTSEAAAVTELRTRRDAAARELDALQRSREASGR